MAEIGHNLPNPLIMEPGEAYRIPGHIRCFQLVARELTSWILEASLDGEHFEPLRVMESHGEMYETTAAWQWARFHRHSGDGYMLMGWVDG